MKSRDGREIAIFEAGNKEEGSPSDLVATRGWFMIVGHNSGGPPDVALSVSRAASGRIVCNGLIVGDLAPVRGRGSPREITARGLRELRLPELMLDVLTVAQNASRPGVQSFALDVIEAGDSTPHVRRQELDDDHFKRFAAAYRHAVATIPRSPTVWLAEQYHVSEPTIRRWAQRARDKHYLGASIPGKPGEQAAQRGPRRKRG